MKSFTLTNKLHRVFALMLTIAALMSGQSAWAASTFTIEASHDNSTNKTTFTITRSGSSLPQQTINYRTVNLSAFAGQHYAAVSGTYTFPANEGTKTVEVAEYNPNTDAYKYQNTAQRSYRFEVLDVNGFELQHYDRTYDTGIPFNSTKVSQSVTDLVMMSNGNFSSGMNSSKYLDVSFTLPSEYVEADNKNGLEGYVLIDDSYDYANNPAVVSTNSLINSTNASASYLKQIGYKIYATVCFTEKERDDGYQYVQIIAGSHNHSYDGADGNGKIDKGPTNSVYKACFELSNNTNATGKAYFPHRGTGTDEFSLSTGKLWQQKYKSDSYNGNGSVILDPDVTDITTRFDAGGDNDDTWGYKDFFVRMALCDAIKPTLLNNSTNVITVSGGPYVKGNTFYISVPFSEIVHISGASKQLKTSWGPVIYESGDYTNVITFKGTITANAGTVLAITSINNSLFNDLSGNYYAGNDDSFDKTFNGITCSATYTLDNGNTVFTGLADEYVLSDNGPIKPHPTVYFYKGKMEDANRVTLTETTNYTLSWTNNDTAGSGTVTATGTGNYNGSAYATFPIRWTTYQINFYDNGNTGIPVKGEMANQNFQYGVAQSLTANTFSREGFTFAGWNTQRDGSGDSYADGQEIVGLTATDGGTIHLYAQWTVIPWTGNGTSENDPYIIQYASQLDLLASEVNGGNTFNGKFFKLNNDITYNVLRSNKFESNFTAIGSSGTFQGTFNGNNKTIRNICINRPSESNQGLFGNAISATIKNVVLKNPYIIGYDNIGGIVGNLSQNNQNVIQDCLVLNIIIEGHSNVGAVVGYNNGSTLSHNYYHDCAVVVGDDAVSHSTNIGQGYPLGDYAGEVASTHRITLGNNITASGDHVVIDDKTYYAHLSTITLNYTGDVTEGYKANYIYNDGTDHDVVGNAFEMPATGITVDANFVPDYATHWHADDTHDGTTAERAYIISSATGLNLLATLVNNGNDYKHTFFKLDDNIDMSSVANFTPIGVNANHPFQGHFDGQHHIISYLNVNVTGDDLAGLFGQIGTYGNVSHVILKFAIIKGESYTGIIAGKNNGTLTENYYFCCRRNNLNNATNVGTSDGDGTGTHSLNLITLKNDDITVSGTSFVIDNVTYYASNTTVTLGYADIPEGYVATYTVQNAAITGNTFTMPSCFCNVNVSIAPDLATWWHADEDHDGTTEERAYLISAPTGLKLLSNLVNQNNSYAGKYFKQDADIAFDPNDLDANGENFTAIGNSQSRFTATFDGQGHTISGIRINKNGEDANANDNQGLFGIIYNATVKNVILSDAVITGYRLVGGLVGGVSFDGNTIENCLVLNSQINITSKNTDGGAICGYNSGSTLTNNCYYHCTVTNAEMSATTNIGAKWADRDGAYCVHLLTLDKRLDVAPKANVTYKSNIYYTANTAVTLSAEGYTLNGSYTVKDAQNNDIPLTNGDTFTMPASDVTVSADLTMIPMAGSGTKADPYIIMYRSQMAQLANTQIQNGKYYKLGRDLTYSYAGLGESESNHTPIYVKKGGCFDGDGHTISGIRVYKEDDLSYAGLFSKVFGTVRNVTLTDAVLTGVNYVGGIAGSNDDKGIIENCHVTNTVIINSTENCIDHGGIAGGCFSSWVADDIIEIPVIRNCTSAATVTNNGFSDCSNFGGIVGSNINGIISGCKAIGATIICNDSNGGIAGYNNYDGGADGEPLIENSIVIDCTLTGEKGMGAITGRNEGDLKYNYYYNSTVNGCTTNVGCDDEDINDEKNPEGAVPFNDSTYNLLWSGNGTEESPWIITSRSELNIMATLVNAGNSFSGKHFELGNDIKYFHTTDWNDATSTENNYTAIGGYNYNFYGTFDGQGHTISGIRIYKGGTTDSDSYQGIFGSATDATIRNVILTDARITGHQYVGGIAGFTTWSMTGSVVENCRVGSDVTIHGVANYANDHGGVVGQCNGGTISGCVSSATLTVADGLTDIYDYGGILGSLNGDMTACLAIGVSVPNVTNAGAIVGTKTISGTALANNCYYNSTVGSATTNIGSNTGDVTENNGAVPAYILTLGTGISATPAAVTYDNTDYYAVGSTVTLSYTLPTGYAAVYSVNGETITGNSFTMPAANVTVSVDVLNLRYSFDNENGVLTLFRGSFNKDDNWGNDVPVANVTSVTATDEVSFTGDCTDLFKDFTNCTSMDLSKVNTSEMTVASRLFSSCTNLQTLNLTGWNTANVTDMISLFHDCTNLETLNLSDWNTANVSDMSMMFLNCSNLTTIYVGPGWNTENVTNSSHMFIGCTALVGGNGTAFDADHVNADYAHYDYGKNNPGYLTGVFKLTLPDNVTTTAVASLTHNGVKLYNVGTTVALSAEGYTAVYTVKDAANNDITLTNGNTFTMPASDVTVSANLTMIPMAGSGTEADPYIIMYRSQMAQLAINQIQDGEYYKLGRDLIYSYAELGETESNYTDIYIHRDGHFDGDGHTISGIRSDNGLFSINYGTVKNITLTDAVITGDNYVGGIAGSNDENGIIENCHVTSTVIIKAVDEDANSFGGIAGCSGGDGDKMPVIRNCTSAATITDNGYEDGGTFGGIVGESVGSIVSGCQVLGASITGDSSVGGIVGYVYDNKYVNHCSIIENCVVIGCTITCNGNDKGTIVGDSWNGTFMHNYYYGCTVNGTANVTNVGRDDEDIDDEKNPEGAVHTEGIPLLDTYSNDFVINAYNDVANQDYTLAGRTLLKNNEWNTLCLPFDVVLNDSPLAGATVKKLNDKESGLDKDGTLTLSFEDETETLHAGTPYIIKWADGEELVNPTFTNATITSTTPTPVISTDNNVTFVGQYSPFEIVADDAKLKDNQGHLNEIILLSTGNKLGYSKNPRTLRPFRCHFEVPTTDDDPAARNFILDFDGTTTAIESIESSSSSSSSSPSSHWHTLDGRLLTTMPTHKGIYVFGGRKVVIK